MGTNLLNVRKDFVDYLHDELIGPRRGEVEILEEPANIRYTAGTLYPLQSTSDAITEEEEEDIIGGAGTAGERDEDQGDDPITLANQYLPSSMGISFYLQNDSRIQIEVSAGIYSKITYLQLPDDYPSPVEGKTYWRRTPLNTSIAGKLIEIIKPADSNRLDFPIFDERLRVNIIWRQSRDRWLVTVSIINAIHAESNYPAPEECIHQLKLICRPAGTGVICAYPHNSLLTEDPEEHILDLLYRHTAVYGAGHGCSVHWSLPSDNVTDSIWSEFLPHHNVAPLTYDLPESSDKILRMYYLSEGEQYPQEMLDGLTDFVDAYQLWITELEKTTDIPDNLMVARDTLISRLHKATERMRSGVSLIAQDPEIRRAFCLANRAMLLQRIHSSSNFAGEKHVKGSRIYEIPMLSDYDGVTWRPFQLAFQLLTLSSVAFSDDPNRDVVDLIWFPTGGGKTEAYLAVTAFLIFFRRMIYGREGGGTTVLMRYTLRLLTTQQFQRAATLLCACEMIRRDNPDELGRENISIGLWVGDAAVRNKYRDIYEQYEELLQQDEPTSPFQVDRCPWCGTEMVPVYQSSDRSDYGFLATPESFSIYCPEPTCPFHQELPVRVVDENLYDNPPTLLLATVDKFARLPWEPKVSAFFGRRSHQRPPELIIQDELHLISGPLGTIVGIYETAIEALASSGGVRPKILASTATIRRAEEQCVGLYARQVDLFPPSGLDARDSYFSREDISRPGRLYVGFMGQGHTASTTMVRASAALLQVPIELNLDETELDAYWTLVAYHNSLRELGKTLTFANDDIPARIKVIGEDETRLRDLSGFNVAELTSNVDARNLIGMLARLNKPALDDESISFLACTNMLSVGIDVPRLGLMLVNGQPKSTSEYIQATSRVGRGSVPGLIICLYSATKPRDRSHFERFVAYHSALYRHVEPTSVTPFSAPARDRALHAVLVSLVRHLTDLTGNNDAVQFRNDLQLLGEFVDFITDRIRFVDEQELAATEIQLSQLINEWASLAKENRILQYKSSHKTKRGLLRSAGNNKDEGWDTLNSMRNVDQSSLVRILGK